MDVAAPMQHAEPAQGRLRMFKEYWARRAAGAPAPEEADNTVMDARTRSMDASVARLRRRGSQCSPGGARPEQRLQPRR